MNQTACAIGLGDLRGKKMRAPSLKLLSSFWLISNLLVVVWLRGEISDARLPDHWKLLALAIGVVGALAPFAIFRYCRKRLTDLAVLGLLVGCCLAVSVAYNEANQLRDAMQVSLDHERAFLHADLAEGVIRPLISIIVDLYVRVLGDYQHPGLLTHGGNTYTTHILINYMFDSATFLAAFALGATLLSPEAAWLYLIAVAFVAQTATMEGRMGNAFLAGGFCWQLFLLTSGRRLAAVISGLLLSFMCAELVFATAFAILGIALFERRTPTAKEWGTFAALVAISLVVPELLTLLHPGVSFWSLLVAHGDDFAKMVGSNRLLGLAVGLASPMLAAIVVTRNKASRIVAVVVPAALVYSAIAWLFADFSEARVLGPALVALALIACERLGNLSPENPEVAPARAG